MESLRNSRLCTATYLYRAAALNIIHPIIALNDNEAKNIAMMYKPSLLPQPSSKKQSFIKN